jgi:hypothetical protein
MYRFAAKVWKRKHKFIPTHDNDCKFIIDLFDFMEESRALSGAEASLRADARAALELSVRTQAAFWKQRGKFRVVREGDENTRFFHAMASQRYRRNMIRALEVGDAVVVAHRGKAEALHAFYSDLLGRARDTAWAFDLDQLYSNSRRVDGPRLVAPFTESEIKAAVAGLDRSSTPGPDGLGPSFFQAVWPSVGADMMRLLDAFHAGTADIERINRAHIILLPKRDGILPPSGFRPVSLQNCDMKIICKALTTRLQAQIADVIDVDQSGFIAGHSISENFVYATEMVQCCFKRRAPTLVLKLDFAKAFDSINWGSLRRALLARGFPPLWCDWMDAIFHSSKSAVVLNGVPGRWINCKRGLRQGDPLSPYLFLIVADILQQLVKQDGVLQHPLVDWRPPLVLQYADDTLIILRAETGAAERLKGILDDFAAATGLVINFSKSTLVPMSMDPELLSSAAQVLGCVVEGFPQTYLGLPLSCNKLALEAFAPLIAKADKYLSGWKALLLSPAGRLVLVNAVLDSLPTHAMAVLQLPPVVVAALDALRRAFLWGVGEERASGAKCLVAWDMVCRPKDEGGLGVHVLGLQNACLLVKLLHRLHVETGTPWAAWRWEEMGNGSIVAGSATSSGGH